MQVNVRTAGTRPDARDQRLADRLGALATEALIAEAELTPKPGLVDRRGAGAHHDLSLELMLRSAAVLESYFSAMAYVSVRRDIDIALRQELAKIGRDAERSMYKATHGSNTHKGAIWVIGLLAAAAAQKVGKNARAIAADAGAIARLPDRAQPAKITHGDIVRVRYGATGARGEASNGFPHVVKFGLPTLRKHRCLGLSEEDSRLAVLLGIMSRLDDTCILYRGGIGALEAVQSGARSVLEAGGYGTARGRDEMSKLDRELLGRRVSPGGSADLLAATIFLDAVEREQCEVLKDKSDWGT